MIFPRSSRTPCARSRTRRVIWRVWGSRGQARCREMPGLERRSAIGKSLMTMWIDWWSSWTWIWTSQWSSRSSLSWWQRWGRGQNAQGLPDRNCIGWGDTARGEVTQRHWDWTIQGVCSFCWLVVDISRSGALKWTRYEAFLFGCFLPSLSSIKCSYNCNVHDGKIWPHRTQFWFWFLGLSICSRLFWDIL